MAQFKFGMFYFRDNTIHVESTDIVTPQYRQQLVQVLKRPDLSSEEGWIQVCWGTRKAPKNKVAAKLLLLGDNYKELMGKKEAFLQDEDIWHMAVARISPCTTTHDGSKPKKKRITATPSLTSDEDETQIDPSQVLQTNKPKMTKAARDRALSQLKSSLLRRNPTTSTALTSEDDTDIDTNVDLFDPPQASASTDLCQGESEEESVLMDQPRSSVDMQQEVMDALKEIPALVKCVRDLITTMKRVPPVMDTDSRSSGSSSPAPEMDLAVLIFGRDVLASSTLTGKARPTGTAKEQLNPEKLSALVDTVIAEFPGTNVSDVRAVMRRKCNNENFVSKKKQ
ncbi:uncharacterized protein LOC127531358 isoform X3 [Acanthochromis polyacanthus]|uniref:uncharacterized protein LOC127531358 isoform X3 n=1 Tax=Acanthochromis polyacanthus TaxID=80966 RepID=UPI00223427DC|nr:uncharacterized protein LOC127531358 isoform X3 [Acanthochromis polyacanthus]